MEKRKLILVEKNEKGTIKTYRYCPVENEKIRLTLGKDYIELNDKTVSFWGDTVDEFEIIVFNNNYMNVVAFNKRRIVASVWAVNHFETQLEGEDEYEEVIIYDNARI